MNVKLKTIKPSRQLEEVILKLEGVKYNIADRSRNSLDIEDIRDDLNDLEYSILVELRELHTYLYETNQ